MDVGLLRLLPPHEAGRKIGGNVYRVFDRRGLTIDGLFGGFVPAFFSRAAMAGFREIVFEFVSAFLPVVLVVCYPAARPSILKTRAPG